jgi:hypothetical protein
MSRWEHPEDLLSALLDGELTVSEAAEVQVHVAACPSCADELQLVRHSRVALRSLPGLAAPRPPAPGFGPPTRWAAGSAAGAFAVALLVVGSLGGRPAASVAPDAPAAVDRHAAAVQLAGHGGAGRLAPFGAATMGASRAPESAGLLAAPARLDAYELVAAYEVPGGMQLLYERGPFGLSVFETEGVLAEDALVNGHVVAGVWHWDHPAAGGRVVVAQRGDLVVTVVGDESADAVLAAARAWPARHRSGLLTRLTRGTERVLDALSPLGD